MSLNQSRPSGFRWRRRGGNKNVPFIFDLCVRRRYRMSGREKTEKTYRRQCLSWKLFMGKVVAQFKDLLACCCAHEQRSSARSLFMFLIWKDYAKTNEVHNIFFKFARVVRLAGGGEDERALDIVPVAWAMLVSDTPTWTAVFATVESIKQSVEWNELATSGSDLMIVWCRSFQEDSSSFRSDANETDTTQFAFLRQLSTIVLSRKYSRKGKLFASFLIHLCSLTKLSCTLPQHHKSRMCGEKRETFPTKLFLLGYMLSSPPSLFRI